jgi:hypothetical protein
VGFSDSAGPDEHDVAALAHKVESGRALDNVAVDGGGSGEVVGVEGGYWEDARTFDCRACAVFQMDAELIAHERIDHAQRRIVARDRLLQSGVERGGGVLQAEGAQDVGEGELLSEVTACRVCRGLG